MWPTHDFQVGDVVKLRKASSHQRVTRVKDHVISTKYLNTHHTYENRAAADFELVQHQPNPKKKKEKKPMANPLYKTKDDKYGTMLTKDSRGWYVLELKGGGGVEAFDPETLEEVVPYTVEVNWANNNSAHVEVPKDSLEVGDIVVVGFHLGRVNRLDTKSRNPSSPKDMRKVGTTKVG